MDPGRRLRRQRLPPRQPQPQAAGQTQGGLRRGRHPAASRRRAGPRRILLPATTPRPTGPWPVRPLGLRPRWYQRFAAAAQQAGLRRGRHQASRRRAGPRRILLPATGRRGAEPLRCWPQEQCLLPGRAVPLRHQPLRHPPGRERSGPVGDVRPGHGQPSRRSLRRSSPCGPARPVRHSGPAAAASDRRGGGKRLPRQPRPCSGPPLRRDQPPRREQPPRRDAGSGGMNPPPLGKPPPLRRTPSRTAWTPSPTATGRQARPPVRSPRATPATARTSRGAS